MKQPLGALVDDLQKKFDLFQSLAKYYFFSTKLCQPKK